MVLVYITCVSEREAKKIGLALVKTRLAACSTIFPRATSFYWWPPKKNEITKSGDVILLLTTLREKFPRIVREVKKLHSWTVPGIFEISVGRVDRAFTEWLKGELA